MAGGANVGDGDDDATAIEASTVYVADAIRRLPERLRRLADRIEQYRPDLLSSDPRNITELEEYRDEVGDFSVIFSGTERALARLLAELSRG